MTDSQWAAVWVAEFSSGDQTSVAAEGHRCGLGMSYGGFLGYLASGRHVCRGTVTRIYARNIDLGMR